MFGKPSATIIFPTELDTMNPIEISDPASGLEAAFVERYAIESLSDPWRREDLCGIYVLLSDKQFTNRFRVRIGATHNGGFEQALQEVNAKVPFWSNAILFSNHDGENLTAEQAELLGLETVRLLNAGNHIDVDNAVPEVDPIASLVDNERDFINDMALFVVRVMFLQGYRSHSLAKAIHPIEEHAESLHPVND